MFSRARRMSLAGLCLLALCRPRGFDFKWPRTTIVKGVNTMNSRQLVLPLALCVLAIMFLPTGGAQERPRQHDLDEDPTGFLELQLRCSDLVAKGTVIAINDSVLTTKTDARSGELVSGLYTFVTLDVDSILHGLHEDAVLTFWQDGGRRGEKVTWTSVQCHFELDSQVVVFLGFGQIPEAELIVDGPESPSYILKGKSNCYVIDDGLVYLASGTLTSSSDRGRHPASHSRAAGFDWRYLADTIREYSTSTSLESLASRAIEVAIGDVADRRTITSEDGQAHDVVVLKNAYTLNAAEQQISIQIKIDGDMGYAGRVYDRPFFPTTGRLLVFLGRKQGDVYLPLDTWWAVRVVSSESNETAIAETIRSVFEAQR